MTNIIDFDAIRYTQTPSFQDYETRSLALEHVHNLHSDEAPAAQIIDALWAALVAHGVTG